ncbi:MAG: hypothetical protein AAGD14_12490 [Planctomycetota bacterium]
MDAQPLGSAWAVFLLAAVLYYRGHFHVTFVLAFVFWGLLARVLADTLGTVGTLAVGIPFGVLPALFLVIHAIDVRVGFSRLPTVYSIPACFLGAPVLLTAATLGVLVGMLTA